MSARDDEIASALPANLDELPRLGGFRLRGLQMTRLGAFIDAAFAFSITMMVIAGGHIPDNIEELLGAFRDVPAFVTSIIVLGIFWRGHWLWSRRYGLEDGVSIFISWGLIVTILIYIYPLKVVFNAMWFFLSDHRFGHALAIQSWAQARTLFAVYAIGFAAMALEILLLNLRAWQLREPLRLNARERLIARGEIGRWCLPLGIGLASLVLALTVPPALIAWSGWVYFSLAVLVPMHRRWQKRRITRAEALRVSALDGGRLQSDSPP